MGNVLRTKETLLTTNEGLKLIRRERTVRMPNGSLRHPVDYYDATACTHIIKERAQICARSFCINSYLSGLSHRHS